MGMIIENPEDFITIGLADTMEVLLTPSTHVNCTGRGRIILKKTNPPILFFRKEMMVTTTANEDHKKEQGDEKDCISYALQPLVSFDDSKVVAIKKVRERLYDFTTNDKLVEIYFDNNTTSKETLKLFDQTLVSLGLINDKEIHVDPDNEETSKLGEYIEAGGDLICKGIDFSSYWLAIGITSGGKQLKKSITPLDEPTSIDPKWERSLSFASSTSSSVKGATKAISTAAIDTFAYIIDKSMGRSLKSSNPTVKSTARTSIKVIDSLSDAGANILYATADTAAELIEHRYGNDAATCAKHSGNVAKNSYKAQDNIRKIGTKSIIKAVGKVAAKRSDGESVDKQTDDEIVKNDDVYKDAAIAY